MEPRRGDVSGANMSEGQVLCLFAVPSKLGGSRRCLRPRDEHLTWMGGYLPCSEHGYTYKKVEGCDKQHHPFQRESVFNLLPYDTGVLKHG